uniref:Uncharacterized protein n=1 Tax=Panagrolaimus davidi TaxID=227884 RepID=A0A914PS00_9BILA
MKVFVLLLFLFLIPFIFAESNNIEILKAKTKFGYFNATFTWTVEQFQLFNFGQRYEKRILGSPTLTAIDFNDGNKVYEAKIIIDPEFGYNNDIIQFEIKTEFNDNEPQDKKYYIRINNSQNVTFHGNKMLKTLFTSVLDDIEITVNAVFSKNITVNAVTSSLSSNLPYDDKPASLGDELLKTFKSDSETEFTIECAGEEIKVYFFNED